MICLVLKFSQVSYINEVSVLRSSTREHLTSLLLLGMDAFQSAIDWEILKDVVVVFAVNMQAPYHCASSPLWRSQ